MAKDHDHYRTYLKIYGFMLIMAADDDEFVGQLVRGDMSCSFIEALRERIEESPRY